MSNDLHNNITLSRVISPISQSGNAAMVGAIVDMQGYGSLEFAITLGTITTAGTTYTALLEESNDSGLSGSNAVADADLLGTEALASFVDSEVNTTKKLGYKGGKRYVRLTMTPAGNTGASTMSAVAVRGNASIVPV
jgi:hypothetical protein